jgi:hypothetical protein
MRPLDTNLHRPWTSGDGRANLVKTVTLDLIRPTSELGGLQVVAGSPDDHASPGIAWRASEWRALWVGAEQSCPPTLVA